MSRNLALARQFYRKLQKKRSIPYCDCKHDNDLHGKIVLSNCNCGENDSTIFNWSWNDQIENPDVIIDGGNVTFHPLYSQGSAIVKGDKFLDKNMIHYWEIKIISSMCGTDLMVGIGTDKVDILSHQYKYSSVLGLDRQSWGYSYRGLVQHNGRLKNYGKQFSSFCIVGVYLDLRRGIIEFYLNRRPQGIAYRQIAIDEDTNVYPMACSTSAKSTIRLINATSFQETLQYQCMKILSKNPKHVEFIKKTPGLKHLSKKFWFLQSKERFQYAEFMDNNVALEDAAVSSSLIDRSPNSQKDSSTDESINEINDELDIYNGVDNIKHRKMNTPSCSSEDEAEDVDMSFFCDHY